MSELSGIAMLSGHPFVGKDTLADYLVNKYPGKFIKFALAAKLKTLTFKLLQLFKVPINSIDELDNRATKEKYRYYLQRIATECIRSTFGSNFWCEQIHKDIQQQLNLGKTVIISDVRFKNEQDYFKTKFSNYPVHCIMIKRPSVDSTFTVSHSSENTNSLIVETVINNNGTLQQFYKSIDEAIALLINNNATDKSEELSNTSNTVTPSEQFNNELNNLLELSEVEAEVVERAVPIDNKYDLSIFDKPKRPADKTNKKAETELMKPINNESKEDNAVNDSAFIAKMNEQNNVNSSQHTGVIGEEYVLQLLREQVRPRNETNIISHQAHVADLESIDDLHNIRWVIEVKNKDNLTRNDVEKFQSDVQNITKQNTSSQMKVMGLFISLRSTSIPKIGELYISQNEIYLSKSYVSVNMLKMVFDFVEQYKDILTNNRSTNSRNNKSEEVEYVLPKRTIRLMAELNTDYQQTKSTIENLSQARRNCSENIGYLEAEITKATFRTRLIQLLNEHLSIFEPVVETTIVDTQYQHLIDYLTTLPNPNNIQKQYVTENFPALMYMINSKSWTVFKGDAVASARKVKEYANNKVVEREVNITTSSSNSDDNDETTTIVKRNKRSTFNGSRRVQLPVVNNDEPVEKRDSPIGLKYCENIYRKLKPDELRVFNRLQNKDEYNAFLNYMQHVDQQPDCKYVSKKDLNDMYGEISHIQGDEPWTSIRKTLYHMRRYQFPTIN